MGFELVTFASIHSSGKRKSKHPFPRSWETWGKNPTYTLSFSTCFKPTAYIPAGTFYSYQNPDYINISLSLSLSLSLGGSRTQKLRESFQPGPVAMDGKESITKQPTNCNYLSWRILLVQTRENINADKHNCKNKDLAYLEHIEPLQVYILSSILVGVSCLQSRKRRLSVLWTQFLTPCLTAKASAELYHYVVMNNSSFGCHF